MTARLRIPSLGRRHPRSQVLSRYLDGELTPRDRLRLEAHVRDCPRCRALLASLSQTIRVLGSLRAEGRPELADSIVAALRAEIPTRIGVAKPLSAVSRGAAPAVVGDTVPPPAAPVPLGRPPRLRALLRDCLRLPWLRVTLPLALLVGIALSLINEGSMIFGEGITFATCVSCAPNFLVPFIALNVTLAMAIGAMRQRRN